MSQATHAPTKPPTTDRPSPKKPVTPTARRYPYAPPEVAFIAAPTMTA